MPIIRNKDLPVQVERKMLNDPRLTFEEKGICAYLETFLEAESNGMTLQDLSYMGRCSEQEMEKKVEKLIKMGYLATE